MSIWPACCPCSKIENTVAGWSWRKMPPATRTRAPASPGSGLENEGFEASMSFEPLAHSSTATDDQLRVWEFFEREWLIAHPPGYGFTTPRELCAAFAKACRKKFNCLMVTVWSLDPVRQRLFLLALDGIDWQAVPEFVMDCSDHLSGRTVERQEITVFEDVSRPDLPGRRFGGPTMASGQRVRSMISIPVHNIANPHQIMTILNLFPARLQDFPMLLADAKVDERGLKKVAKRFARRFEECLLDQTSRLGNRLHLDLSKVSKDQVKLQFKKLASLIREALNCDSVAVYVQRISEDAL